MANFKLNQTGEQIQADLDLLDNNSANYGKVLTADGKGGAFWQVQEALFAPLSAPASTSLVAVNSSNTQEMLTVGDGLRVENGTLKTTGGASIGGGYTLTFGNTGVSPDWWILGGKLRVQDSSGATKIEDWFGWHSVYGFYGTCENAIMFSTNGTSSGINTISGNLYFSDGTKLSSSTSKFDNKLILLHSNATLKTND